MSVPHNRYSVVGACALGLGLSFAPLFFYTMPVLIKPMAAANDWTRTQVSAGLSLATLFFALGSPPIGGLIDRFGLRRVVVTSTILFALALYLFSWVPAYLPAYFAMAAILGLASVGASPMSYMIFLGKWFDSRLGSAMGVSMLGMGIAYAAAPVVAANLVQGIGWRSTYVALSAIALVPIVNALLFVREPSAQEVTEAGLREALTQPSGMTLREAVRSRTFLLFAGSAFLVSFAINGTAVHLVSMISDRGLTLSVAASAGAVLGLTIALARLVTGVLLDHLPTPVIAATAFFVGGVGLLLLWSGLGGATPFVAAACMGLASGAEVDILAFAARRYFGARSIGKIYGVLTMLYAFGAVLGPLALGLSFDRFGGYAVTLLVFAGMCVVAALAVLAMGRPRYAPRR